MGEKPPTKVSMPDPTQDIQCVRGNQHTDIFNIAYFQHVTFSLESWGWAWTGEFLGSWGCNNNIISVHENFQAMLN